MLDDVDVDGDVAVASARIDEVLGRTPTVHLVAGGGRVAQAELAQVRAVLVDEFDGRRPSVRARRPGRR